MVIDVICGEDQVSPPAIYIHVEGLDIISKDIIRVIDTVTIWCECSRYSKCIHLADPDNVCH